MTTVVGFDPRTAERILQLVRSEQSFSAAPEQPSPEIYVREIDVGQVTVAITARSGATPGTGTVESILRAAQATQFNQYTYQNVSNYFAAALAVGDYVIVARIWTGDWLIIAADCS